VTSTRTFVIVGAGLAWAKTAQALREQGFDGQILLLGDEPHRPYERPPLSKDYLAGKSERVEVFVHPYAWYADHDVDLPGPSGDRRQPQRPRHHSERRHARRLGETADGHRILATPAARARGRR
jgi:NADPH-dependent 2,4-dienoyl-CoA reductase/sulfur reductase-like enzyme